MIRFLFYLVVFVLGLAAAAIWAGQMHHLRRALPENLPGWSAPISDDAGIRRGRMVLPAAGRLPELAVTWEARAPGAEGLLWDLRATGQGVDLKGEILLPWWPDRVLLRGGDGAVDLSVISGGAVSGLVGLETVHGVMTDLAGARAISGSLGARARAVTIEGEALGSGPVSGHLRRDGTWQADLTLAGGLSPIAGQVRGALGAPMATLDATIARPEALPERVRGLLQSVGEATGLGLRVVLPVPIRN